MIEVFYAMVPVYLANMSPVLFRWLPGNAPMDFGLSVGGVRLLGDNKTWRGFVVGVLAAVLSSWLLSFIWWPFSFSPLKWGLFAGLGALLGDALKSLVKRRVGIAAGKPWIPFDQIDFTVGALALGSVVYFPGWLESAVVVIASALGHILMNRVGYALGVRDVKW